MQNFALTTWADEKMVAYEPLVARSIGEVTAFAQGMVTERIRNHEQMLAGLGVRYVVEHGQRELHEVTSDHVSAVIGTWALNTTAQGSPLLWTPAEPEAIVTD